MRNANESQPDGLQPGLQPVLQRGGLQRRRLLAAGAAGLAAWCLPAAAGIANAAGAGYRRLLVLVELRGANDSLNTVIPYADPEYAVLRPRIGIPRGEVLQLDERTGLHPALAPLLPLWESQGLAIVQGLGYPQPRLSHFRSIEIWDTASRSDETLAEGWLARTFAAHPVPAGFAADGVVVGAAGAGPLASARGGTRTIALTQPEKFLREARLATPQAREGSAALAHILKVESDVALAAARLESGRVLRTAFPQGAFGNAVRSAVQVAAMPAGVAAIRITLNGFDTHRAQAGTHQRLLGELSAGLVALKSGLEEIGRWDETLVLSYAEFGRRPRENASGGTDHGTAAAHFALGGRVRGGLYGAAPALSRLEGGNLPFAVDFRSLYATVLRDWWGLPAEPVLNGRYESLGILRG